jgi:glycerol uptake facilitator protein
MQAYIGEFIGTMILIILGDGVVAGVLLRNSKAENSGWIVITFGWAMGVAVAVYAVIGLSGGFINPAVTLGFAAIGQLSWAVVPGYIIAQFLGAFVGAVIVWLAYLPHWEETEDEGLKLGVFCTAPAIYNTVANLITEIIGTAVLTFGALGLLGNAQQLQQGGADLFTFGIFRPADRRQGRFGLGLQLDPGRGSDHRRPHRGRPVQRPRLRWLTGLRVAS